MKNYVLQTNKMSLIWYLKICCLSIVGWAIITIQTSNLAIALPNDIHLHFLFNGRNPNDPAENEKLRVARQKDFSNLAAEFGFAIAQPILSPAETLGVLGFDLGIEFTLADIPETATHWRRTIEDERPDNYLFLSRIRLRKGLPFSFEIEGSISFINDSSSMLAGFAIKWALNEGFFYFPDLGVRFSINRLFSSRDLELFTITGDFWLSKQFPIVGTLTITPYAGYSFVFVHATSQVLDPTPLNFNDNEDGGSYTNNFVFLPEYIFGSRVTFGARLVWFFLSLTLEGSFVLPHFDGPEMISTFNAKISFFF
jgi:hypothetical protein